MAEEILEELNEPASDETKRYFIRTRTEEFILEIPPTWGGHKLTFAYVNPASNSPGQGHCIRVYEMPGEKLRAVFDSAVSFRDISIPLARKIKSDVSTARWESDGMGSFKSEREVQSDTKFIPETFE